jgi:sarcosine oxidase
MMDTDVVVVGCGVMGAAAARALSRRGREVVLLEQYEIGHKRGSSHGDSRIFRFSYHDQSFVRMAMEALPLWRELEDESGQQLLTVTGGVDLGEKVDDHANALRSSGAPFERIDGAGARRRYPFLSVPPADPVLFQPNAGIVAADAAVRALVERAVHHGTEVREHAKVLHLSRDGDGAVIETDSEMYRAKIAVVTAGAWAREFLSGAGIEIPTTPTRETVAYFRLPDGVVPPSLVEWSKPAFYSLFSPSLGLKVGEHRAGPITDPDEMGAVSEESVARISTWVADRYPGAQAEPRHAETCLYTNTPDENFILRREGAVVVGSPCSGHGFKFAPVIGERLADLAGVG